MVKYPTKFQFRKTFKYQIMIQLKVFSFSSLLYISLPLIFCLNVNDGFCTGASDAPELSFYGHLYISILCLSIPAFLNVVISLIRFVHIRKKQLRINRKDLKKSKSLFQITLLLNFLLFAFNSLPILVLISLN